MLVFLIENYDIIKAEVPKLLKDSSEKSKSKIMNAIEAYYAEGLEKGKHNTKVQAVKKMVEKELPISLITEIQEVTEAFVKGVVAGTISEIE